MQEFEKGKRLRRKHRSAKSSTVHNVLCIACGADVRSDALYCYMCGALVVTGEPRPVEEFHDSEPIDSTPGIEAELNETSNEMNEGSSETLSAQSGAGEVRRPLTAAMLRRKKAATRRPVEIEWTVPDEHSSIFIIVSGILFLFAVVVWIAALYLR